MFSQDLHENSKYYYLSHKVCCIMKKKNAVFLRNKILCELEGRLELKVYVNIPLIQKIEKYGQDFVIVCTYI